MKKYAVILPCKVSPTAAILAIALGKRRIDFFSEAIMVPSDHFNQSRCICSCQIIALHDRRGKLKREKREMSSYCSDQ